MHAAGSRWSVSRRTDVYKRQILDKVAELIKAGKITEISDMRDETDLSGLKLAIDLKRGVDPDKLSLIHI